MLVSIELDICTNKGPEILEFLALRLFYFLAVVFLYSSLTGLFLQERKKIFKHSHGSMSINRDSRLVST